MKVLDIINGPWAITPEMHREILGIYLTHLRGEKIDIKALEARLGRPLANEPKGYEVRNGTAIIPVDGVIAKRMNMFTHISDGTSSELIAQDFKAALDDGAVKKILFLIDSPGGTVDGIETLAGLVYGARGKKPLMALTDGQMASAAYWLGSAVDPGQLFISGDTVVTGSIGVVAAHVDKSEAEKKFGLKTTEITAGKYKRIVSEYSPLSKEGREYLQEKVDYIYSIFVETVAKHRGISTNAALAMADGKVFIGKQALTAGLVDGVSTLDKLIGGRQKAEGRRQAVSAGAGHAAAENYKSIGQKGETVMKTRFESEVKAYQEKHGCKYGEAIAAVAKAQPDLHAAYLAEINEEWPQEHKGAGPAAAAFEGKIKAYQDEHDCKYGEAVTAVAKVHPDLHTAYLEEVNERS